MFLLGEIKSIKHDDKLELTNWINNGLFLPPPDAVKYRKIIDRKKLRKLDCFIGNDAFVDRRLKLLKNDFENVMKLSDWEKCQKQENILFWLTKEDLSKKPAYGLIDVALTCTISPEILIDDAMQMMEERLYPNLWELKQKITTEYPGNFYHSHNDIIIISPCL